jgi:hypothetical protein
MGRPSPPSPPSPLPETPHDLSHHSISDIGQFITNLFHSKRDGKTRHVCSSSGPPQTHPSLDEEGATYTGKVPIERTDRFNCTGGVDAIKLLRGLRSNLLENAIAFGANVLVDEQYVLVFKRLCPASLSSTTQVGHYNMYKTAPKLPCDGESFVFFSHSFRAQTDPVLHVYQIRYSASATRSQRCDPNRPVALHCARGISGLMTIVDRSEQRDPHIGNSHS